MTFDETIHRAFETLNDRLRAELNIAADQIAAAAQAARDEAAAEARAAAEREVHDRLAETAALADARVRDAEARALDRGREAGWEDGRTAGRREGFDEGRREGFDAGRQEGFEAGHENGVAAGHETGHAAGHEAGHAVGYQKGLESGRREGHDAGHEQGFEAGRQQGEADGYERGRRAERDSGRSAETAASARLLDGVRSIARARSLGEILDTLASCAGREAPRAAVVIARGGRFRGWRFIGFGPSFDTADAVDIAAADAGVIADAAQTGVVTACPADGPRGDQGAAPAFAALAPDRDGIAVPIAMSGQVVAVLYADQGDGAPSDPASPIAEPAGAWAERLEVFARYAARCLEAQTAYKAARVLLDRPPLTTAAGAPADHDVRVDAIDARDPSDADAAARRYAQLLVSEIKLYHEPAVIAGRRERDLATRLSTEIARARLLYEQRVPAHLRERTAYFHDELVRTLAEGDAGLLELRTSP
jgi:hypothetical protein